MQSSVGSSAKCIATIMQHYLTISWVTPACHKSHAAPSETKLLCVCRSANHQQFSAVCGVFSTVYVSPAANRGKRQEAPSGQSQAQHEPR